MFSSPSISPLFSKTLWLLLLPLTPWALYLTLHQKIILLEWEFMPLTASPLNFTLINDTKSALFACVVLLISANVLHFSSTYMSTDLNLTRFTHLILLFILSMNLLLFIPHLMALLLSWDGLGLVSFLLVMYYQNPSSWGAAMMTVLSNRIGDVMILLSIGWTLNQGHWLILLPFSSSYSHLIILSIMVAGMTKSAQMPFSSWLPAAMAAPTPVSALVHSSTLVTAGVFLLIRFSPFLQTLPLFSLILTTLASLTMFMASLAAMMEMDLKKIIALSTLSQLGIMMTTISLCMPLLAFFHLLTHALFKALLFVCAGGLIHLFHHTQDIRQMGNISYMMPLTTASITTATMALSGVPFLAGFYSKDLILESSMFFPTNWLILLILMLGTLLTTAYSLRMMFFILWTPMQFSPLHIVNDTSSDLTTPTICLSISAILGGSALNWALLSHVTEPALPLPLKLFPLLLFLLGLTISWPTFTLMTSPSQTKDALITMWFLTPLTTQKILSAPLTFSSTSLKTIDQGWTEMTFGRGLFSLASFLMIPPQHLQSNSLSSFVFLSSLLLFPLWLMF